jgi:hypothetical protein
MPAREKPIIMSAPMVRAILAGTKTQTRRVLSRATSETSSPWDRLDFYGRNRDMHAFPDGQVTQYLHVPLAPHANDPQDDPDHWAMARVFPRIRAGDVLWVRETFTTVPRSMSVSDVLYAADSSNETLQEEARARRRYPKLAAGYRETRWRPSIHMPRTAARILLRVRGVRVERLNEISYEDALAEGVADYTRLRDAPGATETLEQCARRLRWPQRSFAKLWESINAARAPWTSNPWVWCVEFERCS